MLVFASLLLSLSALVFAVLHRSAHEVLRGDAALLAPEETPEEVLREREARAAAVSAVQQKLMAGEPPLP